MSSRRMNKKETFDDLPATPAGVVATDVASLQELTRKLLSAVREDPVYRLRDEFVGAPTNSWFNHWEITAGRPPVPTPRPPEWISILE